MWKLKMSINEMIFPQLAIHPGFDISVINTSFFFLFLSCSQCKTLSSLTSDISDTQLIYWLLSSYSPCLFMSLHCHSPPPAHSWVGTSAPAPISPAGALQTNVPQTQLSAPHSCSYQTSKSLARFLRPFMTPLYWSNSFFHFPLHVLCF